MPIWITMQMTGHKNWITYNNFMVMLVKSDRKGKKTFCGSSQEQTSGIMQRNWLQK